MGIDLYLNILPFDRRVGLTMFIAVGVLGSANLVFSLSCLYWLSFTAQVVAAAVGGSLCTLAGVGALMWGFRQLHMLDHFAETAHLPSGPDDESVDGSAEEGRALSSRLS